MIIKLQQGLHRYKPDLHRASLLYRANSLPDKELRYLRTIIVIADIDEGLIRAAHNIATMNRQILTFSHWSGVTPYTSSCEFAGSCVFGKQSPEILSLRPRLPLAREKGQALSRSYGRFFAEFLREVSPVRLGLLDLHTCVGLRYGSITHNYRRFSWKLALQNFPTRRKEFSLCLGSGSNPAPRIFLGHTLTI